MKGFTRRLVEETICHMYEWEGYDIDDIAVYFEISFDEVTNILKDNGFFEF